MALIAGLTKAQSRFVRALQGLFHDELVAPDPKARRYKPPKPQVLNAWLDEHEFRSHYLAACQSLRDQMDSALLQSGVRATARLVRSMEGQEAIKDDVERRTLIDIVRTARAVLAKDPSEKQRKLFADTKQTRHPYWPLHESHWPYPERIAYFNELFDSQNDPEKYAKFKQRYPNGMPRSLEEAPPFDAEMKRLIAKGVGSGSKGVKNHAKGSSKDPFRPFSSRPRGVGWGSSGGRPGVG